MYEPINQNKVFQLRSNNRYESYDLENERILSLKTDIYDEISNEPYNMVHVFNNLHGIKIDDFGLNTDTAPNVFL